MRRAWCWVVAAAVFAVGAVPVRAAEKGRMVPEEGALEVMLLLQPSVCKDLDLSADKRKKIENFADGQWKKAQALADLEEKERDKRFEDMTKENEKFVSEVLSPDQKKRLHQIILQTAGLLCVTRPHVAKELKLSDEQKKRAAQMQQEARDEVEELIHETGDEQKDAKLRELHETSRKRLTELLTDEQESKWKELTGKPFKGEIRFADANTK
jgi:hypothetical protein